MERKNQERVSRAQGSQPTIFKDAVTDALGAMVMALLGEVMVLRDRLDAHERLAGGYGPADVDAFRPDPEARAYRAAYRRLAYDRVLGVARDKLLPDSLREQRDYDTVLDEVTTN
ncbi:hypothetical protein [Nitrospirillum pindoramense]|uniref:Uncharacterized protein n=1 Tax=Nitrospirillum amazonense TaxID=28077 RepID=A0A560H2S9_9PROT|nr:hypothetical protein [Nitrospirillum amazonense]TWB40612.1 hypothetical protein FBZ90_109215 [Nitrospirillum amazonense]